MQASRPRSIVTASNRPYGLDSQAAPIELEQETIGETHTIYTLTTRSDGENRQPGRRVTGRYHRSNRAGLRPLVVILPIWGASTWPAKTTVRHLLQSGMGAEIDLLVLDGDNYLFDWTGLRKVESEVAFWERLGSDVEAVEVTVRDIRRIVRWGAGRSDVDPQRVALVGYSIGAVLGPIVLAQEPRISAAALVMAGGHLHEIMASCPRRPGRVRRQMLDLTGWSVATYESRLEPFLASINPVLWAPAVDPSGMLMIDAGDDSCMPPSSRDDLWEALGRPHRISLPFNHRYAFLTMTPVYGNWSTRRIVSFLEDKLSGPTPAHRAVTAGGGLD